MSNKKVVTQQTTDIQNALTNEQTKSQNETRKDTYNSENIENEISICNILFTFISYPS